MMALGVVALWLAWAAHMIRRDPPQLAFDLDLDRRDLERWLFRREERR